jgi:hypothetical protein
MSMMNPVTRYGLIAGAISGEVMVLMVLINTILLRDYSGNTMTFGGIPFIMLWNIVFPLLVILIFEIGGIFAARLSRTHISDGKESFLTGFIAGVTSGIVLEAMWFSNIVSLVYHTGNSGSVLSSGFGTIVIIAGLLVILVVMGGILSAFGSYIYSSRTLPGKV